MTTMKSNQSIGIWIITVIAVVFGLLTIKSGGSVLFVDGIDREDAGNYVPFVLWFNFLAGFAYLLTGAGLFMQKHWAAWISIFIVIATIIVFTLFGLHILRARAKITSHFIISSSSHYRLIFLLETLKITSYSCCFAHSDQPMLA